ncbi:hypothetical protein H5410_008948 [Solanum commersonii]|uniref:Uncharacterized protein n=1 Tax=Solanum commersonii TaxID=4109 RepID=A0A9J6AI45_SOLCO|nr:hypothetical protein H5410_008948 [Solanum commersonii]
MNHGKSKYTITLVNQNELKKEKVIPPEEEPLPELEPLELLGSLSICTGGKFSPGISSPISTSSSTTSTFLISGIACSGVGAFSGDLFTKSNMAFGLSQCGSFLPVKTADAIEG